MIAHRALSALCAAALLAGAPSASRAAPPASADIRYEEFTLPNGLRVVVHTDRKAPIVAVNLWYHVGSKDEPPGRTGFAHLFEHLMFNGSENHRGEFFEPFEKVGATDQNGTTNIDRTNYFQNVPTTALDLALWMESDRMGHLLGAVDQKVLDEQRGVVQNEKRQGENQPYGQVWDRLLRALYPKGHPYRHRTIGSMVDLDAATLDDARTWFKTWYGPNNAVLVLAGDIDVATAREKVAKYFGHIPAGPTMAHPKAQVPRRARATRETIQDRVPQARVYRTWAVAPLGGAEYEQLQLFATVLGGSVASRLDTRLVHRDKLADTVSTGILRGQLGSTFLVTADVKQGVAPAKVEKIIDEELARLLARGPTAEELDRAKTLVRAGFIRGVERIGGFGGKADVLAECSVYLRDPGCFRELQRLREAATVRDVKAAGGRWLKRGSHTLVVLPGDRTPLVEEPAPTPTPLTLPAADPRFTVTASAVDRKAGVPLPQKYPDLKLPAPQRASLKNGIQVILAERHEVPVVQLSMLFDGGYRADAGAKLGTSGFTMQMLTEGAADRDALAFGAHAESLGAEVSADATLDNGRAHLSALRDRLDESLALYADMLRRPRFAPGELERVRGTWIAAIKQEKARPQPAALRVLPPLLYGAGHPYAIPFTGRGTEASIGSLVRDDLVAFHRAWIRPEKATLVVVGDTTLAELVPLLEKHLGDWRGEGEPARGATPTAVARPAKARVFLIDRPGSIQAVIVAGLLIPPTTDAATTRFELADSVLGGSFTARLNMNLREDKHWSYGAYSFAPNAVGPRPWMAFAPVQIDKTVESIAELKKEIEGYVAARPATKEELALAQAREVRSLPGSHETATALRSTMMDNVVFGRPDDYVVRRKAEIEALTLPQLHAASKTIDPRGLTWVVVGDLAKIEAPIRALNLGEVQVLDADGQPATGASPPAKPSGR